MTAKGGVAPAPLHPCVHCPWRTANQGQPHPLGWYTKANLRRLWAGLRRGEDMSCHPTDPRNPVPDGTRPVPQGSTTLECAGSLILKQRELMRFQGIAETHPGENPFKLYRQAHPRGLTREGVWAVVSRAMFGGVPIIGGREMTRPDLNEAGIGAPDLADWDPAAEGSDDPPEARAGSPDHG